MASSSNSSDSMNMSYDDNFDLNDFVNIDQGFSGSPTPSVKVEPNSSSNIDPRHMSLSSINSQRQYNGPSHDYGQWRQQTGLPSGAISHVKAVNAYSSQVRPNAFGAAQYAGYNTGLDMDFDASSAAYFYPNDSAVEDRAVDPSALAPTAQPAAAVNKAWPGMHSEQAKAEAAAKQQNRDRQMSLQQPLPTNFDQTLAGNRSRSQTSSEPQVNDQISRLLTQMRKGSSTSNDDDDDKDDSDKMSHAARMRGDEEEMDEDERLLASEEGKKLTSKERRQLRNKVSARAFRSRRKEYITQLEGDIAVQSTECNELKQTIRRQEEQINQLTQLTRAMLGHPAFGNFMEEMSTNSSYLDQFSHPTTQPSQQSQPQSQPRQQANETTHVGMSMIPENPLDFSTLNLGGSHWAAQNFQIQTTFAVFQVPQGPSLEESRSMNLSGKGEIETIEAPAFEAKAETPIFVAPVFTAAKTDCVSPVDYTDIKDDSRFALYLDALSTPAKSSPLTLADALSKLDSSLDDKSTLHFNLRVTSSTDMRRVGRLLASAESTSRRLDSLISHLPQ